MADALILEFEGFGAETYERVNGLLGIDMQSGEGDWPDGLLMHAAATKPGGMVIYEIWASQADQERFMENRLGQALPLAGPGEHPPIHPAGHGPRKARTRVEQPFRHERRQLRGCPRLAFERDELEARQGSHRCPS